MAHPSSAHPSGADTRTERTLDNAAAASRRDGSAGSAWRHAGIAASVALLVGAVAFALCERAGWPMLAQPAASWLSERLQRQVLLTDTSGHGFALHLWGGLRVQADQVQLANPTWTDQGPMLLATNAQLQMRWRDLLWAPQGGPLRIQTLSADTLQLKLLRPHAQRASWLFAVANASPDAAPRFNGVALGGLLVRDGSFSLDDAVLGVTLQGHFGLGEGGGLQATARGRYNQLPLALKLNTGPMAPWWSGQRAEPLLTGHSQAQREGAEVATQLDLDVGQVKLAFDGRLRNPTQALRFSGQYRLQGPSLAAVGEPTGLTLPATPPFSLQGSLVHAPGLWQTVVAQATVGRSQLAGAFEYRTTAGQTPALLGRVKGRTLWLADLGPAIGLSAADTAAAGDSAHAAAPQARRRLLPDRRFDLPSLAAMNANVLVDIDRVESGVPRLQAVSPLRAHLTLRDAVLAIDGIDARLAQGHVRGRLQLDGRAPVARWQADLRASGLDLAAWIAQPRADGVPPYVTGRLAGQLQLAGTGRSTAEMLAASDGRLRLQWTQGHISHLALELAGLDLAQALGVLVSGDDALPVNCAAADLRVKDGVARPDVLLVDTRDSTLWAEGAASLATERLSLVLHANPKDLSPLALRTPLQIKGSFAHPEMSVDKAPLLQRLLPAVGLAFINPLAALLPLIDTGDAKDTEAAVAACRQLLLRHTARSAL